MSIGYVYVLSNPTMEGLLKVGYTTVSVEKRAKELSVSTGIPQPFIIECYHLTDKVEDIESQVHTLLEEHRVNSNREFFKVSVKKACREIAKLSKVPVATYLRQDYIWSCRRCGYEYVKSKENQFCPKCGF